MTDRIYPLSSLNTDVADKISLNNSIDWFKSILDELNEAAGEEEATMVEKTSLIFDGEIKKSKNAKFGEYVLLKGRIQGSFVAQCVKTGEMIFDNVDCEIKSASLAKHNQTRLGLEDGDSVFLEDEEHELFFFENNQVDLEPVIHEFVFLNKNPYPSSVISPDGSCEGSEERVLN